MVHVWENYYKSFCCWPGYLKAFKEKRTGSEGGVRRCSRASVGSHWKKSWSDSQVLIWCNYSFTITSLRLLFCLSLFLTLQPLTSSRPCTFPLPFLLLFPCHLSFRCHSSFFFALFLLERSGPLDVCSHARGMARLSAHPEGQVNLQTVLSHTAAAGR